MKLIPLLLCAFALAATPMASHAGGLGGGLGRDIGAGMGWQDNDRGRHRRDAPPPNTQRREDDRRDPRDMRGNPGPVVRPEPNLYDRRVIVGGGPGYRPMPGMVVGGEQRDNRINRAIAIGQGHGRVLNAWPQGGSIFVVRVNTPHGRVDMIIDVDSGRIIGER